MCAVNYISENNFISRYRKFSRFFKNKSKACKWLELSFLSDYLKEKYIEILEERYRKIEIT